VFDVTDPTSLKDVSYWLEEIERHGNTHCATVLIGNKTDLHSKRQVSEDEGLEFANKNKLDYIECSALNATNIDLVFETIAKKVLR
jgi:GTPase SAR1 family protein